MKVQVSKLSGIIKNRKKTDEELKKTLLQHMDAIERKSKQECAALENNVRQQLSQIVSYNTVDVDPSQDNPDTEGKQPAEGGQGVASSPTASSPTVRRNGGQNNS